MTARELYDSPYIEESKDVRPLNGCYYAHLPELQSFFENNGIDSYQGVPTNEKVTIRLHGYRYDDFRREHNLRSVWFDGKPFMVTQNAGREGDDHTARWITDKETYDAAIRYLISLIPYGDSDVKSGIVEETDDLGDLDTFYGKTLLIGKQTPDDSW